jgi:fibronectin type 3 domain-containing protein
MMLICGILTQSTEGQQLVIASVTLSNRSVTVRWEGGDLNRPYQLQKLPSLPGTWENVEAPTFADNVKSALSDQTAFYRVTQNSVGISAALFDQDPPTVPAEVDGYAASCGQVVIYWNPSSDNPGGSGLKEYFIYRDGAFLTQVPSWATSFLDSGLIGPSANYDYALLAIDVAGNASSLSSTKTVTTPACNDPSAPTTPTGLLANPINANQINLSWNSSTDSSGFGIGVYDIYRNGRLLKQVHAPATSTSDTGLMPNTTYAYTVSAVNNASQKSAQSSIAIATTCSTTQQQDLTPPSQPTNLTLAVVSCLEVDLSWSASTDNACGTGVASYSIFRDGTFIDSVAQPATTYSDTNIVAPGAHTYTISAFDGAGNESALSQPTTTNTLPCNCTANISTTSSGGGTTSGGGLFNCGPSITVKAIPNSGFNFSDWTQNGTVVSMSADYQFMVSANRSLVANFNPLPLSYNISVMSSPSTGGTVSGGGTFTSGSSVTVTATPGGGYSFANWTESGTVVSASSSYSFTATSNRSLVANFTAITCTSSLSATNASFGSNGGSSSFTITTVGGCSWTATTTSSWIHTAGSGTGSGTVNYSVDTNFSANFRSGTIVAGGHTFTVNQAGSANPDTTPPTVVLTSPGDGSIVSNTIMLSATANDNGGSGVSRVEFYLDSLAASIGTATMSPYTVPLDTTILANGSHTSFARAYDAAGNSMPSTMSSMTVKNTGPAAQSPGQSLSSLTFGRGQPNDAAFANAVATDQNGNLILAGRFTNTIDFGGGPVTDTGGYGGFVTKRAPSGNLVWDKEFAGPGYASVSSVAVDHNNNILAGGNFIGTIDFGGGSMPTANVMSIFLLKYSTTGSLVWLKVFTGPCSAKVNALATDSVGNVLLAGYIGGGAAGVNFGTGPLVSSSGQNIFIAKLAGTGSALWAKRFGSDTYDPNSNSQVRALALDGADNPLIAGEFSGTLDFGPGSVASAGARDIFIAKCSSSDGSIDGGTHWARTFGDAQDQVAYGLAVDSGGNVLVTGNFSGLLNFGAGTLISSSSLTIFLAKLSPFATSNLWAQSFTNTAAGADYPGGLAVDTGGNILLTGSIAGGTDFGGGPLSPNGASDIFTAKFSSGGSHVWAERFVGFPSGAGQGITTDNAGSVLLAGWFTQTIDFGVGQLNTSGTNAFLARLSP